MDTKELKRTAPKLCAKHDRFMEAAGRPDMKIGESGWIDFFDTREPVDSVATPEMLTWTIEEIEQWFSDRERKLINRANELKAEIYACDRIGIYH